MAKNQGKRNRDAKAIRVRPIEFKTAKQFVSEHHRHAKTPVGHRFSIGIFENGALRGVLVAGRPVARSFDPLETLEATRVCTDGLRNGCSQLLGAFSRAAKAMGYLRVITYTQQYETGASLKASGWDCVVLNKRVGGWDSRKGRKPGQPASHRWELVFN